MESILGLLRIRVKRGINLAVRDVRSSDPYVVIRMGNQVGFSFFFLFSHLSCSFVFFLLIFPSFVLCFLLVLFLLRDRKISK